MTLTYIEVVEGGRGGSRRVEGGRGGLLRGSLEGFR